ncbi:MAG: type II toxin-antitoxin system RelE/ParE family toxin [Methylococcaceae bacterium]
MIATKTLARFDINQRNQIFNFLKVTLPNLDNPRQMGKALTGNFKGLWRYRIGDYRVICEIIDNELIIVAIEIGHRKDIYK